MSTISFSRLSVLTWIIAMAMAGTGCGKNGLVTGAAFTSNNVGGDVIGKLSISFNLGGISLPTIALPLINAAQNIGALTLGGKSVVVDLNITKALNLKSIYGGVLPNGAPIPLSLPAGTPVFAFPAGGTNSWVYIAVDSGVSVMGSAIAIREFDGFCSSTVGSVLCGLLNLFPSFSSGSIKGVFGLFTGAAPGTSGIATFVDLSGLISIPSATRAVSISAVSAPKPLKIKKIFNSDNGASESDVTSAVMDYSSKSRQVHLVQ